MPSAPHVRRIALFLMVCALIFLAPAYAQTASYSFAPESRVWVEGISNNTPEWTVYATELEGSLTAGSEEHSIEAARLVVTSRMLKSKKSTIMDRVMYDAIKVKEYPHVTYELKSADPAARTSDSTFTTNVHGELTLGSRTNAVTFPIQGAIRDGGLMVITGSYTLLLTDYDLQPPTAMFGSLRTGNEITVHAELIVKPNADIR